MKHPQSIPRPHRTLHACALWLAVASMVLRGLLPAGYMPVAQARSTGVGSGFALVLCSGAGLRSLPAADGRDEHGPPAAQAGGECPYALALAAGLPPARPAVPDLAGSASAPAIPQPTPAARHGTWPRPPARGPPVSV